ncbi:APC family permease [Streptomyces europaeiscabiei]|uniref:APC family permease n=1 Tax=Streptomyces europaeiscabiei TaxID=146819 RepID=UPI0029ADE8D3|nr:APC family permease [Streptomyces europaeiscabiei]MDX3709130.1 APC family permease [Streptomyces europaeiscabiei]MDX3862718.1 APC family permease [Streptomyces europaeiscabiei]MDX3870869.1 APC family permease [Streptomyces europaeiscabiei]
MRHAAGDGYASTGSLKQNALGVLGILFFVLSAQAPLTGVAGAAPVAIAIGNGPGVPAMYVVAGVVVLLFSVGYVAMGRHVVDAGAFYSYVGKGLGGTAAAGSAGVALLAYHAIQAAVYGLFGAVMNGLALQYLETDVPWWLFALGTMVIVQGLGATGVDVGAKVLAVFVLAEISLLLVFGVVMLLKGGGPEGLAPGSSFSLSAALEGAPGVALMFAVASMFGFEATAIYGEEAREPHKTVPRATYLAVVLVTAFFAFTSWMLISAHGPASSAAAAALEAGDGAGFVAAPVSAELGAWAGDALPILLATSLFASILAFHNSANRYLFSLGREGLLPRALSTLNGRQSPWLAGLVQTGVAALLVFPFALAGKDPVLTLFSWLSGLAVLAIMLLYLLTSVSVIVYFRHERSGDTRLWNTLIAPALGAGGIAGAIWLIISNFTTLIGGDTATAVWLGLAVPGALLAGMAMPLLARSPHRR